MLKKLSNKLNPKDLQKILLAQQNLANALDSGENLNKGLTACLDAAIEVSGLDCGGIYIFDDVAAELRLVVHKGIPPDFVSSVSAYGADSANMQLIMKGEPFYINYQQWEEPLDPLAKTKNIHAVGVLPMQHKNKIIGCLNIGSYTLDVIPDVSRISLEMISVHLGGAIARLKAEKALQESEERYRISIEESLDGVALSQNGRYVHVNKAYLQIFGYDHPEEIVGKEIEVTVHPDDKQYVRNIYNLRMQGKVAPERYEFKGIRKDGTPNYIEITARKSHYRGGALILASFRDVTDKKEAEKELIESESKLEKRAQQLTRLSWELTLVEQRERDRIAEILHDELQQLMVGAKIGQEMLIPNIDNVHKPTAGHVLDLIDQSIKTSRSLVSRLSPHTLKSGDLSASLKFLARWIFENQGFEVKLKIDGRILVERELNVLIYQSTRELLLNVIKHAGVKSAVVKMGRKNGELRIVVSDQGVGFDPTTALKKGIYDNKFGLFSIRERLQYLGGRVEIKSTPNTGSTISMILTEHHKEFADKEPWGLNETTQQKAVFLAPVSDRFRVLLVDDHPVMRDGLCRMLGLYADVEVVGEASDGEQAVYMARDLMPDVILMDINMPNMNGVEATRIIHSEFPHIRIIALSMYDKDEMAAKMIEAGASAYRSKSQNTDLLLATIRGKA